MKMRWWKAPLLALVVLAVAGVGAATAGAQTFSPIEFPNLTVTYRDAQGPGTATITNLGPDGATEGSRISVNLSQNGVSLQGQGFVRQTGQVSFVAAFWLADGAGNAYFMEGAFVRGFAGWSAQGRYQVIGNPNIGDQWTMATAPCPVC